VRELEAQLSDLQEKADHFASELDHAETQLSEAVAREAALVEALTSYVEYMDHWWDCDRRKRGSCGDCWKLRHAVRHPKMPDTSPAARELLSKGRAWDRAYEDPVVICDGTWQENMDAILEEEQHDPYCYDCQTEHPEGKHADRS
jgi:hypothetical protein